MELYIWRLTRIGFSVGRAVEICMKFGKDHEGLDHYISDLEELECVRCG